MSENQFEYIRMYKQCECCKTVFVMNDEEMLKPYMDQKFAQYMAENKTLCDKCFVEALKQSEYVPNYDAIFEIPYHYYKKHYNEYRDRKVPNTYGRQRRTVQVRVSPEQRKKLFVEFDVPFSLVQDYV